MNSIFSRIGIFISVFFLFLVTAKAQLPTAKHGVIDLRNTDLSKQSVPLDGEWGLCWEKLCEPGVTNEKMTGMISFPKRWDNTIVGGKKISAKGYASYMLTILLPKNASNLALDVPDTYTSYKLFVDDAVFVQSGIPGVSAETTKPKWQQFTRELFVKKDTVKLILQVANFLHSKGGPYKSITIGNKEKLFSKRNKDNAFNYILTGSIVMCGLFFLAYTSSVDMIKPYYTLHYSVSPIVTALLELRNILYIPSSLIFHGRLPYIWNIFLCLSALYSLRNTLKIFTPKTPIKSSRPLRCGLVSFYH